MPLTSKLPTGRPKTETCVESSAVKKAIERLQSKSAPDGTVSMPRGSRSQLSLQSVLSLPPDVVEAYATLTARLERALAGMSRRAIVVGATGERCGASSVAIGLSATLAASTGVATLLVDANLRRPNLHRRFDMDPVPGLVDLVHDNVGKDPSIRPSGLEQLSLVLSGRQEVSPQTFFQRPEFGRLLDGWTERFGYVILDSAPVGELADSIALAQQSTGVVLVVEATRTSRDSATEVVQKVRESGVEVFGGVLNKRRHYIPEWIYKRI